MGAAALAQPLPARATPAPIRIGRLTSLAATHAVLLAGAVFMLLPFIWMLDDLDQAAGRDLRAPISVCGRASSSAVENYDPALTTAPLLRFALNGFIVCFGILVVQLLVAIPCAYALAKLKFPGRNLLFVAGAPRPVHPGASAGAAALHRVREARAPEHLFRRSCCRSSCRCSRSSCSDSSSRASRTTSSRPRASTGERVRDRLAHRRAERLAGHRRLLGLLGRSLTGTTSTGR